MQIYGFLIKTRRKVQKIISCKSSSFYIMISNNSSDPIYIGTSSAASNNGMRIGPLETLSFDVAASLYIGSTKIGQNLRVSINTCGNLLIKNKQTDKINKTKLGKILKHFSEDYIVVHE